MKLGKGVLLEIVRIVQNGMMLGKDISEDLRKIDVSVNNEDVDLSQEYLKKTQIN